MNTPITDRFSDVASHFVRNAKVIHASHAEKLETDRAALMEALEVLLGVSECADETGYIEDTGFVDLESIQQNARAALSSARANFPES